MNRRELLLTMVSGTGLFPLSKALGQQRVGDGWQEATSVAIDGPEGLTMDSSGRLYIAEAYGGRILVLDTATKKIRSIVGGGQGTVVAGANAQLVQLRWPTAIAVNDRGQLWIVDHTARSVVQVDIGAAKITKVIGGAELGQARVFDDPNGIVISATDEIYVADCVTGAAPPESRDHGIFKLDPGPGRLTRITGLRGPIRIVPRLLFPGGLAFDSSGLLYIADQDGNRIVQCDLAKKESKVLANVSHPRTLAIDGKDILYFTEGPSLIRAIDLRTGSARVVAGTGSPGFSGDGGPAIRATMIAPFGLAVDRDGNLFIGDSYDNRIRMVDAKSGVITTVAGNGSPVRKDIKSIPRL